MTMNSASLGTAEDITCRRDYFSTFSTAVSLLLILSVFVGVFFFWQIWTLVFSVTKLKAFFFMKHSEWMQNERREITDWLCLILVSEKELSTLPEDFARIQNREWNVFQIPLDHLVVERERMWKKVVGLHGKIFMERRI